ncbi:hypothetical protein LCGC14_2523030 [marine sediment metagenome]|uniref:Uncharacterized protein n=1 Tax=marine sediment metagenome TaxID=412755 RepID=A0A0F9D7H7_9ZZZZ
MKDKPAQEPYLEAIKESLENCDEFWQFVSRYVEDETSKYLLVASDYEYNQGRLHGMSAFLSALCGIVGKTIEGTVRIDPRE